MIRFKCTQCPKEYQSQKDLDKHMRKIHGLHGLSPAKIRKGTEKEKSEFVKKCIQLLEVEQ